MPKELTVAEYLTEVWLPAAEPTVKQTTIIGYATHIRLHINPHLGGLRLSEVTPQHLNRLYAELRAHARPGARKGLVPTSIRRVHATLRRAFTDAVRWGYLTDNPVVRADPPRMAGDEWHEMQTWTGPQLKEFLEFVKEDPLYAMWHVFAMTGMRRGEVVGLRWSDVNLDKAELAVRQAVVALSGKLTATRPKTPKSRRVIALDPGTVEVLRRAQEKWKQWNELIPTELVFPAPDGSFLSPDQISHRFVKLVADSGLPKIRLHDLRHTHATLALEADVHPKILSERLGHASVAITLDTYSHVASHLQTEAAEQIAALVFE